MTRDETLAEYDVDSHGMIRDPGKFEAEMLYVPHFWDISGDGSAEILDWPGEQVSYVVELDESDRAEFPELGSDAAAIHMEESDSGFVSAEVLTAKELDALRERNESEWEEDAENWIPED
jgi:hypothetical protein